MVARSISQKHFGSLFVLLHLAQDPVVVPAFGGWRKDSEHCTVDDDSILDSSSLEGLSYAFQQARLARVVSRKEESAQRPVPVAEVRFVGL